MRVRRIDTNGDWTFGQGMANYAKDGEAVRQNVLTRLKSFQYDWFLDMDACIDWISILGNKNNAGIIRTEIRRVAQETEGVLAVNQVIINKVDANRRASITITITTIYDTQFTDTLEINI
jgi:hypothetical protein